MKLRIYLQDSLGRSFPNELENVNLKIKVTNSKVIDTYISEDKKYLILKAKTSGASLCTVYL